MPDDTHHCSQSNHNIDFLKSFFPSCLYNDWAITVAFYTSLHIVENAIFKKGKITFRGQEEEIKHSNEMRKILKRKEILPDGGPPEPYSNHIIRQFIVNENFEEICDHYKLLYSTSITARYRNYCIDKRVTDCIIKVSLVSIIDWSNSNFGTKFPLSF